MRAFSAKLENEIFSELSGIMSSHFQDWLVFIIPRTGKKIDKILKRWGIIVWMI